MKKALLLSLCIALVNIFSFGQGATSTSEVVAESLVPEAVKTSFSSKYTPTNVVRWEKRTYTGAAGKTYIKYVVIFDIDGLRHRSRYKEDGTGLSTTTYFWFKNLEKLPQEIKDYAKTTFPDYKLGSAEKEHNLKSGQYVYRLRLKKGSIKLIAYVNERGQEITKDNIDSELLDNESESAN